jgi:hypothetical protein
MQLTDWLLVEVALLLIGVTIHKTETNSITAEKKKIKEIFTYFSCFNFSPENQARVCVALLCQAENS